MPGLVNGVIVQMPGSESIYHETYFNWSGSSLIAEFNRSAISGGILQAWHHVPVFSEIESHIDAETFYFVSGVAIMLFADIHNGKADLESAQMVRIQPGTQMIIHAGKGHFVPVAEGDEPVQIIVVAPKMDAPRVSLSEVITGV